MIYCPGTFILEEMLERGWTRLDMQRRGGFSLARITNLVFGEVALRDSDAAGLARAFGTSTVLWTNLEKSFRDSRKGS